MSQPTEKQSREQPLMNALVRSDPGQVWTVTPSGTPVPDGYAAMMDQLRGLLDRVTGAAPPAALVSEIARLAAALSERLGEFTVPEEGQVSGQLVTLPGRGQVLTPAYTVDQLDDRSTAGRIRFGRHFLGSSNAVHGGAIPLVFDELLGRLALTGGRTQSRTAYLHAEYRSITPIDTELQIEGWSEREEGRKRFLRGLLRDGDRVCAEVNALFVALRPGQP